MGDAWAIRTRVPGAIEESLEGMFANFRVAVRARLEGRPLNRYYYLQFRRAPGPGNSLTDACYRFSIDPEFDSFDLARWDSAEQETILVPETRLETLIRPRSEENWLVVEADGPRIRLFINDVQVGEAVDNTYPWGHIGFGVGSGGEADAEARFRDLVITAP